MFECNSCRIDGAKGLTTVTAGEVPVALVACGYEPSITRLPKLMAADQTYSAGLCPGSALEKGTMFPELVSEY